MNAKKLNFPSIVPLGQALVALGVSLLITKGTTDPVVINARANTALATAGLLTDVSTGDVADAQQAFNDLLQDQNMDPVVALELKALADAAVQEAVLAANIGKLTAGIGALGQAALNNIIGGTTTAANAEIAAHPLPTAPEAPVAKQA